MAPTSLTWDIHPHPQGQELYLSSARDLQSLSELCCWRSAGPCPWHTMEPLGLDLNVWTGFWPCCYRPAWWPLNQVLTLVCSLASQLDLRPASLPWYHLWLLTGCSHNLWDCPAPLLGAVGWALAGEFPRTLHFTALNRYIQVLGLTLKKILANNRCAIPLAALQMIWQNFLTYHTFWK